MSPEVAEKLKMQLSDRTPFDFELMSSLIWFVSVDIRFVLSPQGFSFDLAALELRISINSD
jgi:hypothetical protein